MQTVKAVLIVILGSMVGGCAGPGPKPDPWTGRDKFYHLAISAGIAAAASHAAEQHGRSDCRALGVGVGTALVFGMAKEVYDQQIKGTHWSWRDGVADVTGAAIGGLVASGCR